MKSKHEVDSSLQGGPQAQPLLQVKVREERQGLVLEGRPLSELRFRHHRWSFVPLGVLAQTRHR